MPIEQGPFYALPACVGVTYTCGGIAIDEEGRVRSKEGGIVEGLYAAGSATGGLEGGPNAGYVGGLMKALVFGLRAAEHIANQHRP
jgi:fumarate reductase flavoprotein subunit